MKFAIRNLLTLLSISIVLFLTACSERSSDAPQKISDVNLAPLQVEIIAPKEGEPNTEIILQALVMQGEEKVNDASEVLFEVWQQGQKEESHFSEGILTDEDGVYETTYHFIEENLYYIQPHVTARGTHVMPVEEITIGEDFEVVEEDGMERESHKGHNH